MIEYVVLLVVVVAFVIASLEDIKKKEVYDYINFTLFFFVAVACVVSCIITKSLDPLFLVLFGGLLSFFISYSQFSLGFLGFGDVKFLIGFGAALFYIKSFFSFPNLEGLFYYLFQKISFEYSFHLKLFVCALLVVLVLAAFTIFGTYFKLSKKDKKNALFLFLCFDILILCIFGYFFVETDSHTNYFNFRDCCFSDTFYF